MKSSGQATGIKYSAISFFFHSKVDQVLFELHMYALIVICLLWVWWIRTSFLIFLQIKDNYIEIYVFTGYLI